MQARVELDRTVIRSPIKGVVIGRNIDRAGTEARSVADSIEQVRAASLASAAQSDQVRAVAGVLAQNSALLAESVTAFLGEVRAA